MTMPADPHPSRDQLTAFSDGRLAGDDVTAVESHVAVCEVCAAALGELGAGDELISRLRSAVGADPDATSVSSGKAEGTDQIRTFLAPSTFAGSLGRLGHYEVLECLGQGAFGIVFRAFDDSLQRVVALKVLSPALTATSPPRKRFLREARSAAQVRHEHVVQIYAVEELPTPYLVMEYIPGETLQERLDRCGPLEVQDVLRLGCQMARGLAAAHKQGLIHRDIKPGNILLESGVEERVKITDFGLARAADDAHLTQSGIVAGTPMFMAPEQARGETIDQRADLFSLGSVLYTMVSGRPPFRASNTVAVLKRVCDDTPRPIPELIPETPQWLCDIIARLQAKDAANRFQSAGEVADLLGQQLARLQQQAMTGSPTPDASSPLRAAGGRLSRPTRSRRWATAAALLICALGGLGLTEATGVTQIAATVIRILTPEGTLVVEVTDPTVKVTIEGDGGLTITGAGLHEVRLKPGSYKLRATREGKPVPLDRELVTITRGGEQVVQVRLENDPTGAGAPQSHPGAFVLLGGSGVAERPFDSLAEAIQHSIDEDTIEVRGDGPFALKPIVVRQALTIRAAASFRPSFQWSTQGADPSTILLHALAPLVLEGLEFQFAGPEPATFGQGIHAVVLGAGRSLHVAHCRFRSHGNANHACIGTTSSVCVVRDSLFLNSGRVTFDVMSPLCQSLSIENCVCLGSHVASLSIQAMPDKHTDFRLRGNTLLALSPSGTAAIYAKNYVSPEKWNEPGVNAIQIGAFGNVIDAAQIIRLNQAATPDRKPLLPAEAESLLSRVFHWEDRDTLYASGNDHIFWSTDATQELPGPRSLADWNRFWGDSDAKCQEGQVRFHGGDLASRLAQAPGQLTLEDFRLRPDSAGYRAGKDGKDLGADVDLIGPGAAYERWKTTPEYQQWLEDIGQMPSQKSTGSNSAPTDN